MHCFLHIDTSGSKGLIMLSKGAQILSIRIIQNAHDQSAQINPMIAAAMTEADTTWTDIDALSVVNGPGSYTGLRVGLATAKAIAFVHNIPLILHHKLALMLASAEAEHSALALIKAREGEVFVAARGEGGMALAPQHMFEADLLLFLQENPKMALVGARSVLDQIEAPEHPVFYLDEEAPISHEVLVKQALARYEMEAFDELMYATPFYLKQAFTTTPKK